MSDKEIIYEVLEDGTEVTQSLVDTWVQEVHEAIESGAAKYTKRRDMTPQEREALRAQLAETK
jgi:hypothetical protein